MPRLVGKQTNHASWIVPVIAIVAIGVVARLEYIGYLNLIPQVGRDRPVRY